MANLFFGSPEAAMGKTIRYENSDNFRVSAVFEDLPANSSQQFEFLRSWIAFEKENADWIHNWGNTDAPTFIQLRPDANLPKVRAGIKDFVYRYQQKSKGFRVELDLVPYPEKYLHSTFKNGQIAGGRIEYIHLFSMVAVFILLIACINFMNLATARSAKRAKEVGVRKVIGAARPVLADPRDRCPKGARCKCDRDRHYVIQGFFGIGRDRHPGRFPPCLVPHVPLAAGFCVQNADQLVDICRGRSFGGIDRIYYGQFPGYKSRHRQPGEKPAHRMTFDLNLFHPPSGILRVVLVPMED
jgi:hypothetical protein